MSQALPVDLFDVPICPATLEEATERVHEAIQERHRLRVGVVNAAKIVNMRRDPALKADVLSSDAIFADGMSVVWASRLLRQPLPERVTGIDLMLRVLARGQIESYRVYLLGATPEVLADAAGQIRRLFPDVQIVGTQHGYFTDAEEADVATRVCRSRADVLFVAMTSPRKERFMARWGEQLGVPVVHGVGGSFDVLAGRVKRAPSRWQRLGLEWLYRVAQEPRRLGRRYLITNSVFLALICAELVRRRRRRAKAV